MYDIIVVGAGMAGMTAALYCLRTDKSVLIIEAETVGGQIANSPRVENYPTIEAIGGSELANRLFEQVLSLGAEFELARVKKVEKVAEKHFKVTTEYGVYEAKAVIVAAGAKHRPLGLAREEELVGKGVSYCAVCDGPFFKGEDVALIGGANSALQYALALSGYCTKVHMIVMLDYLMGEDALIRAVRNTPNVQIYMETVCEEFMGEDALNAIKIRNKDGVQVLPVKGAFVAIGQMPDNDIYTNLADLNQWGYFDAGEDCTTKTAGFYVAGDCRSKRVRQLTTAAADGAAAAIAACAYLGC
jgi:thioredoxin reductase (NADPH)